MEKYYDAKPNESPIQGLWGELQHRTSSIPLIGLQTDLTEFRQPLQVESHLEMPGILVQLGHIQHT